MGLFETMRQIAHTANTEPYTDELTETEARWQTRYHRIIVYVSAIFAALGVAFGVLCTFIGLTDNTRDHKIHGLFIAPFFFGVGGFFVGMTLTCLFAPKAFLSGPVGTPWMKLIGTKSVAVARIVCLIFGLVVSGPLVGLGLFFALSK